MSKVSSVLWREAFSMFERMLGLDDTARGRELAALEQSRPDLYPHVVTLIKADQVRTAEFLVGDPLRQVASDHTGDAEPQASQIAGATIGPYTLERPLGSGGMGEVWFARRADGLFEAPVALKLLHAHLGASSVRSRFVREGKILGQLQHSHIAHLLDAGVTTDGQLYLAIEHVEGLPLDRWCDEKRLDIAARLKLFLQVCDAVAHAHAHLVVHRDLKPSNILVTANGDVKLLDFGIAKLVTEEAADSAATELTRVGGRVLTPAFAAPEQVAGHPVTVATDVYSLGVLLYLLLSGRRPYGAPGDSVSQLERCVLEVEPPPPSRTRGDDTKQLRGDLDTIVLKALKKNPSERYLSVTALREDLQRYLDHRPVLAQPDSFAYRARKYLRRNRVAVLAASAIALAIVAGIAGTLWQAKQAGLEAQHALTAEAEANKNLATAKAVSDFVTQDLLAAVNPDTRFTANITLKEMLGIAAAKVDERFGDNPEVAAQLHYALGKSYYGIGMHRERVAQQKKAVALFEQIRGPDAEPTLKALSDLGAATKWMLDPIKALRIQEEVLRRQIRALGAEHPSTLVTRLEIAQIRGEELGDWENSVVQDRQILATMSRAVAPDDDRVRLVQMSLADALDHLGDYEEAERTCREVRVSLLRVPSRQNTISVRTEAVFAHVLVERGKYTEAAEVIAKLQADARTRFPAGHPTLREVDNISARLSLERGDLGAPAVQLQLLEQRLKTEGEYEDVRYGETVTLLAETYQRSGQYQAGVAVWRKFAGELGDDPRPLTLPYRLGFADTLREAGQIAEASQVLHAIPPAALSWVPRRHPLNAERLRVQGLLWLHEGKKADAQAALEESLKIYEFRLGSDHWRTKRAREELALTGKSPTR